MSAAMSNAIRPKTLGARLAAEVITAAKENAAMAGELLQQGIITDQEHQDMLLLLWKAHVADSEAHATRQHRSEAVMQAMQSMPLMTTLAQQPPKGITMNAKDILEQIEATQAAMRAQSAALSTFSATAMAAPPLGASATDMLQSCLAAQWDSAARALQTLAGAEHAARGPAKAPQSQSKPETKAGDQQVIDVEFKVIPNAEKTDSTFNP